MWSYYTKAVVDPGGTTGMHPLWVQIFHFDTQIFWHVAALGVGKSWIRYCKGLKEGLILQVQYLYHLTYKKVATTV